MTIRWTAPAAAATFDLQYTIDNGSTWKSIVKGVTGRSYEWTVPYLTANKAKSKVKLIARNAAGAKTGTDVSDAPFAITVIVLKGPNGGESYGSGEHASIAWITNGTARTGRQREAPLHARRWIDLEDDRNPLLEPGRVRLDGPDGDEDEVELQGPRPC